MNKAVEFLLHEHEHMQKVLSAFRKQLDTFEAAGDPDYEILSESLAYCRDYLEQWHHPREDVMLEILQKRDPDKAAPLVELEEQHKELARMTLRVVSVFRDVSERGAIHVREDLVTTGGDLVSSYRNHIRWEETHFFPAVEEAFTPADWEELDQRLKPAPDPLDRASLHSDYRNLLAAITG